MRKSKNRGAAARKILFLSVPLLEAWLCQLLLGGGRKEIVSSMLWVMFFCGMAIFYLERFREWLARRPYYRQIIFVCMIIGLPFAFFYGKFKLPAIFYLGAILIAALVELGAGLLFAAGFWAFAVLNHTGNASEAVSLLMLGLVLCLLAGFLREKKYLINVFVLGGMATAILYFLRASESGLTIIYKELGREIFATAAIQASAALLIHLYVTTLRRKRGNL